MVGIETVLRDDPLLTCRIPGGRSPRRIVVDSRARLPMSSQLVATVGQAPLWVACTEGAPRAEVKKLTEAGCEVLRFPARDDQVDLPALFRALAEKQLTNVLVEGGSRIFGSLFEAHLVDRVMVFIAPKLVGGERGPTPVGGPGVKTMAEAWRLTGLSHRRLGDDLLIEGKVVYGEASPGA
jgi:diaminohydroxyphosphoribosylaminopyrimidine deaminase/5-amino-6-(5-phosphoribosylamino)uracil reductase